MISFGYENFVNWPCGMARVPAFVMLYYRLVSITTENAFFAEGLRLCRGPNLGKEKPSAKKSPRQRKALGKDAIGNFGVLSNGSRAPSVFAEGQPSGPR